MENYMQAKHAAILCLVCDLNQNMEAPVSISQKSPLAGEPRERLSHPQRPPLPTLYKIYLPVYVIVTNKRLQALTAI